MRPLVEIDREECLHIDRALAREWLETNGLGGYASSTVLLCPTRRQHGLLVSPLPGEIRRFVFLARFEESLSARGKSFPLSMGRYAGLWHPHGHQAIEGVRLIPYPSFLYRIGDAWIRREILMVHGGRTVLVRYAVENVDTPLELKLVPLYAFREADALTGENMDLDPRTERLHNGIRSRPYRALPPLALTFASRAQRFEADPVWYRQLEYTADLELGYPGHEDQFSPGHSVLALAPGADVVVAATIDEPIADPAELWARESEARQRRCEGFRGNLKSALELGADHFLYRLASKSRLGVLAGFPWHREAGRDTFIALPGILLSRGEVESCGQALEDTLPFLRRGLMPRAFGPTPESSLYESVSASLWFARAVQLYDRAHGSPDRVRGVLRPALEGIVAALESGSDLGISVRDGLLWAGSDAQAVTWMNARTSDGPVTPRAGFAVEINALWYFLLAYLEDLATRSGHPTAVQYWRERRERAGRSFLERFWLDDLRYLADTWRDGAPDKSIRPNMVIASALEFSPLSRSQRVDVFEWARAELLTPRGLRSLAPEHERYRGHWRGDADAREQARHQGSVFPWLSSFYVETYLRSLEPSQWELEPLSELVLGFVDLLHGQGLNQVSELFDGDPPYRSGGAFAQAVNSSELLRALHLLEEPPQ